MLAPRSAPVCGLTVTSISVALLLDPAAVLLLLASGRAH